MPLKFSSRTPFTMCTTNPVLCKTFFIFYLKVWCNNKNIQYYVKQDYPLANKQIGF